jgi:hypothetical protein
MIWKELKMLFRIWDSIKDKMLYQEGLEIFAIKDNSYWKIKAGLDNVELIETNQNCAKVMFNTFREEFRHKDIYEYDVLRRDWYSFKDQLVLESQYGIVYYSNGWKIKMTNGLEFNLTHEESGREYEVRSFVVGNYFEGYKDSSSYPTKIVKWDYSVASLLANI